MTELKLKEWADLKVAESSFLTLSAHEPFKKLLDTHWGISQVLSVKENQLNNPSHSRVFLIGAFSKYYILKEHICLSYKKLFALCEWHQHALQSNIPTSHFILTKQKQAIAKVGAKLYTLQIYNPGRFFDCTSKDIIQAARYLALFHLSFQGWEKKYPLLKQELYPLDLKLYAYLKKGLKYFENMQDITIALDQLDKFEQNVAIPSFALSKTVGHFDYHPYNLLYDLKTSVFSMLLDFELVRYDHRARDIALALAKLCMQTDENLLAQQNKMLLFLQTYQDIFPLVQRELKYLPFLLINESKKKVCDVLHNRLYQGDPLAKQEILKQVNYAQQAYKLESF